MGCIVTSSDATSIDRSAHIFAESHRWAAYVLENAPGRILSETASTLASWGRRSSQWLAAREPLRGFSHRERDLISRTMIQVAAKMIASSTSANDRDVGPIERAEEPTE